MCVDKAVGNGNSYFDLISFSALLQLRPFVRLIFSLLSSLKIYIYIFKLYAFIYTSISIYVMKSEFVCLSRDLR